MTDATVTVGPSSIVGNTPGARAAATATRSEAKGRWKFGVSYITMSTLAILLVYMANAYDWSFFWLLLAGALCFPASWSIEAMAEGTEFESLSSQPARLIRLFAIWLMIGTVVNSPFVGNIARYINGAENEAGIDFQVVERIAEARATATALRAPQYDYMGYRKVGGGNIVDDLGTGPDGMPAFLLAGTFVLEHHHAGYCATWTAGTLKIVDQNADGTWVKLEVLTPGGRSLLRLEKRPPGQCGEGT